MRSEHNSMQFQEGCLVVDGHDSSTVLACLEDIAASIHTHHLLLQNSIYHHVLQPNHIINFCSA